MFRQRARRFSREPRARHSRHILIWINNLFNGAHMSGLRMNLRFHATPWASATRNVVLAARFGSIKTRRMRYLFSALAVHIAVYRSRLRQCAPPHNCIRENIVALSATKFLSLSLSLSFFFFFFFSFSFLFYLVEFRGYSREYSRRIILRTSEI